MKNWKDPSAVLATEEAFIRLSHVLLGLILWEIATTCDYDIDVLRGRRRYLPTYWIYFTCRLSMAVSLTILIITDNISGLEHCTAWDVSSYAFAFLSLGLASSLILLRIFAVWKWQWAVVAVSSALWVSSIALNIRSVFSRQLRSEYVPQLGQCVPIDPARSMLNSVGILGSDLGLLLIMLVGVLNLKDHKDTPAAPRSFGGLWRLLWYQGVIWLTLAAVVEVPALVFIILNLNDPWDVMFEIVTLATISISATRMYRVLTDYQRPRTEFLPTDLSGDISEGSTNLTKIHGSTLDDATRVVMNATWDSIEMAPLDMHCRGAS
ncbi:hypothetical protein FA95DRAFT_1611190 [Auriscalpium vulgare]|uniref:Uncharacterized protein n=1 Tax=Auriscalpium vulgare TaxID=40419 RepID=A0ACB8RC29_9AGAM|nr:hypothetical protein FA95DRAFT_1611190 [Auriscalpium vulgare]